MLMPSKDSSASIYSSLRTLRESTLLMTRGLERLSTGMRINRGADDPAGLIASESLRATIATLDAEARSLERADLVANSADAAMGEMESMLTEAEALAIANANDGALTDEERAANQMEIDSLVSSVNRLAGRTSFGGRSLLDGTMTLTAAGESLTIADIEVGEVSDDPEEAAAALRSAREAITAERGRLGSFARHTIGSRISAVQVATANLSAAESAIRDADYGHEVASLSRADVLMRGSLHAMRTGLASRSRLVTMLLGG
jgi:flagellin